MKSPKPNGDEDTPLRIARQTIEGMLGAMDGNLRFKDQGAVGGAILDDFLRHWTSICNMRDWARDNVAKEKRDSFLHEFECLENDVQEKIEQARNDPMMWEVMTMAIHDLTLHGKPLPVPLAELAVEIMRGEITRPAARGRRANTDRDLVIQLAVMQITTAFPETTATRNEATDGGPSACEIVADVLAENGVDLGYRSVEKIWSKRP